ncbi:MAG: YbaB/EbfC family nucleoid-associated protein [Clostridia bacterium]|nr:YbaB/EbfC family nucleoid-associated protein [Clostridia bacterium]
MKARIPGAPDRGSMMKKMQEMQENMQRVQEEVENSEFSASAGGGAVEVSVNGKNEVLSVKISPDVVDPEDTEMLEDLIMASVNEALRKAAETMEREMGKVTGGMPDLSGLGGLL